MFEGPVQDLIDELGKLPGIGPKSAQRIAFHLISVEPPDIDRLTAVLSRVRDGVQFCEACGNVSDAARCRICGDARRDGSTVCVVEEPKDVQAVERTREFRGRYHVLGGALDPLSGIGPEQLRIRQLLNRIGERVDGVDITEVIIATDPNTEGEATAHTDDVMHAVSAMRSGVRYSLIMFFYKLRNEEGSIEYQTIPKRELDGTHAGAAPAVAVAIT